MKLWEALKSGKKFRKKGEQDFCDPTGPHGILFGREDILSDDWEIEEEPQPRRLAWINDSVRILMLPENKELGLNWKRAPWLDNYEKVNLLEILEDYEAKLKIAKKGLEYYAGFTKNAPFLECPMCINSDIIARADAYGRWSDEHYLGNYARKALERLK